MRPTTHFVPPDKGFYMYQKFLKKNFTCELSNENKLFEKAKNFVLRSLLFLFLIGPSNELIFYILPFFDPMNPILQELERSDQRGKNIFCGDMGPYKKI